jgi:NAD(P)-dependent dehydrogenase (short-subunit alcohol dehydrogenase family)
MPRHKLTDKVVVVTGASRGLGAATARAFAQEDARVVLVSRDQTALDDELRAIQWDGQRAAAIAADCTDPAALEHLRTETERIFGPVDALLAFAGGSGEPTPTHTLSLDRWSSVLRSNLDATFLTIREFLPGMIARKRGAIVTIASAAARQPSLANAAYATAKGGVITLTRHLAREYGPSGIRANCISPSAVMNERMQERMTPAQVADLAASFPLGRIGQPDDVAEAALYLASDASSWVTGVVLDVAGGKIIV